MGEMMFVLADYVRNNFDGMLVFGDVHGDYESIKKAYDYANGENFFFMSLGDLVDRSHMPYETVELMHRVIREGRGGFTIGNHDDKFHRYANGNKVHLSRDAMQTLVDVGTSRETQFLHMYKELMDDTMFSGYFHVFDDIYFAHAAAHKNMFNSANVMSKSERSRYLVGETNGDRHDDGYPVRLYSWVDDVPHGKTIIVGHDRCPFIYDRMIAEPLEVNGKEDGKVIFMDTGGGKGGHVTGAVIMPDKSKTFKFVEYKEFK